MFYRHMQNKKIFLIGYMAVGKSTLGKKIASILDFNFIDLDNLIEEKLNCSINTIFEKYGERAFRETESEQLKTVNDKVVLSTGGGTPIFKSNMDYMLDNGLVVYLEMPTQMLVDRILQGKNKRPLVKGISDDNLPDFVENHLMERLPFYNQAHFKWDARKNSALEINELANQIKKALF